MTGLRKGEQKSDFSGVRTCTEGRSAGILERRWLASPKHGLLGMRQQGWWRGRRKRLFQLAFSSRAGPRVLLMCSTAFRTPREAGRGGSEFQFNQVSSCGPGLLKSFGFQCSTLSRHREPRPEPPLTGSWECWSVLTFAQVARFVSIS